MGWNVTPSSIIYLMAALINLVAAFMNWFLVPVVTEMRKLSVILFLNAIWLLGGFFELACVSLAGKMRFLIWEDAISGAMIILLFFFILDYFHRLPWFRGWWRRSLWILLGVLVTLGITNPFHHMIWTGEARRLAGTDAYIYGHGPFYWVSNAFGFAFILLSFALLIHQIHISRDAQRKAAILLLLALAYPFFGYLMVTLKPDTIPGMVAIPFGYAFVAIFGTWIVFDHLHDVILQQTRALRANIVSMEEEIQNRKKLEIQIRESQEILAKRLADQSNNTARFYDLLLINNDSPTLNDLLDGLLAKAREMIPCTALCYYRLEQDHLVLEASHGLSASAALSMQQMEAREVAVEKYVCAVVDTAVDSRSPRILARLGYRSAQLKWVIVQENTLGLLCALWKEEKRFSIEEIVLFSGISYGLGLILENCRLRMVAADRARNQERRRLARDLHDSVTQSLHSLTLSAETATLQSETDPVALQKTLKHLGVSARQALKEMRLLLYELRLVSPSETNLTDAIRNRLEAVERRTGLDVHFVVDDGFYLPKTWEAELYPLVMETLNNSLKHARAHCVSVYFGKKPEGFSIEITDDGVGFRPSEVTDAGMGLRNIQERCLRLNAYLNIVSAPGQGTTLSVRLPAARETMN